MILYKRMLRYERQMRCNDSCKNDKRAHLGCDGVAVPSEPRTCSCNGRAGAEQLVLERIFVNISCVYLPRAQIICAIAVSFPRHLQA